MNNKKTIILTAVITFLVTAIIFSFLATRIVDRADLVKALIERNYAGEIDKDKMEAYSAKGVVASLGDEHSDYYTEEEFTTLFSDLSGKYKGVGIEVYINELRQMEIASVFPDTPAYNAGLKSGDIIKSVGPLEASYDNFEDVIKYIRGISDEGKAVETISFVIERDGGELQLEVVRNDINIQTVLTDEFDNIYYINIKSFSESTSDEFKNALEVMKNGSFNGLIIDVRDNPGGYLETVIEIADLILPESTIVYTSDKNRKTKYFNSDSQSISLPIVVLINKNSASASEILAGALHDNYKATLVGEKTFGKGSVQEVVKFPDGSALKLTTAHYYTPSGVCIDGIGIEPDIAVELSDEANSKQLSFVSYDEDAQLQKAVEVLK